MNYYTLDVGYSFIVEAARLAFPSLPDNHLRALALQLVADAALVVFVFFVFSQWNAWLGLLAAYLYTSNGAFYDLVSFAYYYYWDIPLTFVVLGALLLACRRPAEATAWLTLAGAGARVRRVAARIVVAAVAVSVRRRALHAGAAAQAGRRRSSRLRSSRRRRWCDRRSRAGTDVHDARRLARRAGRARLLPESLRPGGEGRDVFKLTTDKYGVAFRSEDY